MKRSWLIGAVLVFSLSAVACSDDDDNDPVTGADAGKQDGSVAPGVDAGGLGIDGGFRDASTADGGDAG